MERQHYYRLPLEGAFNTRELGGIPAQNGVTNYFQFLRADSLAFLTKNDIAFLKEFGLKAVIDLRSEDELEMQPNPFNGDSVVTYYNVPFSSGKIADATRADLVQSDDFLAEFYLHLLDNAKKQVKDIFEIIAENKEGVVLFHCSAGKDRTGILAMLLLGLAGVNDYDIAANYQVSYTYLRQTLFFKELSKDALPQLLTSKEDFIYRAYKHLIRQYDTIENYLLHCGVSETTLKTVKDKLVG